MEALEQERRSWAAVAESWGAMRGRRQPSRSEGLVAGHPERSRQTFVVRPPGEVSVADLVRDNVRALERGVGVSGARDVPSLWTDTPTPVTRDEFKLTPISSMQDDGHCVCLKGRVGDRVEEPDGERRAATQDDEAPRHGRARAAAARPQPINP